MSVYFSKQVMSDLMITAWEGGSNYWVELAEYIMPEGMSKAELRAAAWAAAPPKEREFWKSEGPKGRWPLYSFLPFLPPKVKWSIKFTANEGDYVGVLTPKSMREGAPRLLNLSPRIYANIREENYDAGDADAWLQAAIFNEIVFG